VGPLLRLARGIVEALGILAGVLLTLLICWWSLLSIPMPECGTDPDNTTARLILQAGFVLLAVAVVAVSVVTFKVYRRLAPPRRTLMALAYPVLVVTTFVGVTGLGSAVLGLTSANGPSANCF